MKRCCQWMQWGAIGAVLLAGLAPPVAQGQGPAVSIPKEAYVSLEIPDLKSAWTKWKGTTKYKWSTDASMKAFKAELLTKNLPSLMNPQAFLGFEEELLGSFAAPAAYFGMPIGKEDGSAFVIQTNDKASVDACLSSADKHFTARKWTKTQPKIPGCVTYTGPKEADGTTPRRVYLATGTLFAVTSDESLAQQISDGFKSKVADTKEYQEAFAGAKKLAGGAPVDAMYFTRPLEWITYSSPKPPPPDGKKKAPKSTAEIMKEQQFGMLQGFASLVNLKGADGEPEEAFCVIGPPPYEMGLRMLEWIPGKMPVVPKWLPAKFATVSITNADPLVAFDGYGDWIDVLVKSKGAHANMLSRAKIDIRKDHIAKLNPTTIQIVDFGGTPAKWSPQGKRSLRYQTIKEGAGKGVLEALTTLRLGDPLIEVSKIGDWTVWTMKPGGNMMIGGSDKRMARSECEAISGLEIISSSDGTWLHSILKGSAGGLPTEPRFLAASAQWKAWETADTSNRSYNDQRISQQTVYEGLRLGTKELEDEQESKMLRMLLAGDPQNKHPEIYKKLPKYADVQKFQLPTVTSVQSVKTGMLGRNGILSAP